MIRQCRYAFSLLLFAAFVSCGTKPEPRDVRSTPKSEPARPSTATPAESVAGPVDRHEPAELTCNALLPLGSEFNPCAGLNPGAARFFPSSTASAASLPAELTRGDKDEFTLVALPDTQYYAEQHPEILLEQVRFVLKNQQALQVRALVELGDLVQHGASTEQWQRAAAAFGLLERASAGQPHGLPYGVAVGNHDQEPNGGPQGTEFYNRWFGRQRFVGREYYGGHHATDNDNSYLTFTRGKHQYLMLLLEYDEQMDDGVLAWARDVLRSHPRHFGIVVSHFLIDARAEWGEQGRRIYAKLRTEPNLSLMMSGHMVTEARRSDPRAGGMVHTLLSDYQSRARGGEGWLRLVRFFPNRREIGVFTYSPLLGRWEVDANSRFDLSY
ncbi:MAG TPA: metallophosphoesterase [Polyangiaceae bacterium]|nr:metallophosphoesterase [Polyangiaceae bacterium]